MLRCALLGLVVATGHANKVTPLENVIGLLKGLQSTVEKEGAEEAAQYDKYACFCKEQADEKNYQMEKSDASLKTLRAEHEDLDAKSGELTHETKLLKQGMFNRKGQMDTAASLRAGESAENKKEHAKCMNNHQRIKDAIKHMGAAKDATATLAQVRSLTQHLGAKDAAELTRVVGEPGKEKTYTYHEGSHKIIAILEDLAERFRIRCDDMEQMETDEQHRHNVKQTSLQGEQNADQTAYDEKSRLLEETNAKLEQTKADIVEEDSNRRSDEQFLQVLVANCEEQAHTFDQRSKSRSLEVTALNDAITTLESGASTNWGANKKLVGMVQQQKAPVRPTSFLQLRGAVKNQQPKQRALQLLSTAAGRLGSTVLSAVVMKVQASGDHFVKVRSIIKDLVLRLELNHAAEAKHKSFCDQNMANQIADRDAAQAEVEKLQTEISQTNAEIAALTQRIAELATGIAEDTKALTENQELRTTESKENQETVRMSADGAKAVEQAIAVLTKYYDGGHNGFVQTDAVQKNKKKIEPAKDATADRNDKTVSDLAPEALDTSEEYTGHQGAAGGIVAMLQSILDDFENTHSQVADNEVQADMNFEKFRKENEANTLAKTSEKGLKEGRKTDAEDELLQAESNKADAEKRLKTANDTLQNLKTQCVDGEESYEERVAKREQEIKACKEALQILEDAFTDSEGEFQATK